MEERWPRLVGGNLALDFVNTDLFSQDDRSVVRHLPAIADGSSPLREGKAARPDPPLEQVVGEGGPYDSSDLMSWSRQIAANASSTGEAPRNSTIVECTNASGTGSKTL